MSDAVILAVVAMVCVIIGGPVVLAMYFGRWFHGRANKDGFELSTGPAGQKPEAK